MAHKTGTAHRSEKVRRRTRADGHLRRGASLLVAVALAIVLGIVAAAPASAYATTGCRWSTGTLRIDYRYVNGVYRTELSNAKSHYNTVTDVDLSLADSSGPSWTAANSNYGATGWNGHSSWSCLLGWTNSSQMQLNQYYIADTLPGLRIRLVWLHEMGHSLGLAHVDNAYRVMYGGGTGVVYNNGIVSLTTDDKNGINALY